MYLINSENKRIDPISVHVCSETPFLVKGTGVNTAFLDIINLLRKKDDIKVFVNAEENGECDIFHSTSYGPWIFWKGRKYPKHRRVHTCHVIPDSVRGSLPFWKYLLPFVKWYFKQVYNFHGTVIAISPFVEKAIKETGAKCNIVRLNNPIPVKTWERTEALRELGRQRLNELSKNL